MYRLDLADRHPANSGSESILYRRRVSSSPNDSLRDDRISAHASEINRSPFVHTHCTRALTSN
jgi:hypothetical protein